MAAIVPRCERSIDLVRLVDGVDGFLYVPEVLDADVVPDAAELSLDSDT